MKNSTQQIAAWKIRFKSLLWDECWKPLLQWDFSQVHQWLFLAPNKIFLIWGCKVNWKYVECMLHKGQLCSLFRSLTSHNLCELKPFFTLTQEKISLVHYHLECGNIATIIRRWYDFSLGWLILWPDVIELTNLIKHWFVLEMVANVYPNIFHGPVTDTTFQTSM